MDQFADAIEDETIVSMLERNQLEDGQVEDDEDEDLENEYLINDNEIQTISLKMEQSQSRSANSYQPMSKKFHQYEDKINLNYYNISNKTFNLLNVTDKKIAEERKRVKDKCDRATVEQVLDPRTRIILFKLINRRYIDTINGCISTGKEANVYHATGDDGIDKAVKIYKTSILIFKDRDKYVSGEFRFRHGYCRHNPRKMVRTWAEKEMRNLWRIYQAGINCPQPRVLRSHVLVMDFVGRGGLPAPLLKDVPLTSARAKVLYYECLLMMRKLYHTCHLVHADLSEFNLLYHNNTIYVIDVSQSVEHDHPNALEFLRKDCTNINDFFARKGVLTMSTKELFDFVTDPNISEKNIDKYLEKAQTIAEERSQQQQDEQQQLVVDEEVFKQVFIPHRLEMVPNFDKVADHDQKHYATLTALNPDLTGPSLKPAILAEDQSSSDEESDEEAEDEEGQDLGDANQRLGNARPKDETPEERKVCARPSCQICSNFFHFP